MTRLVFATFGGGFKNSDIPEYFSRSAQIGIRNILATRAYPKEVDACIQYASLIPNQANLWIDSGAFTAWTKGADFSISEYYDYLMALAPRLRVFSKVFVVGLDKIPGKAGTPPAKDEIKQATDITFANFAFFQKRGINVMPIHHQGEPLWILDEYLKSAEYIGLSPANDSPHNSRLKYLSDVWRHLKQSIDASKPLPAFHNFGNISPRQLKSFPFWSADSQSWRCAAINFGREFNVSIAGRLSSKQVPIVSVRAKKTMCRSGD